MFLLSEISIYLVFFISLPRFGLSSLTIERRSGFSDRIIDKENGEVEKNSFLEDGSCMDSEKRTIASRYWDNMITCFTEPELKTLGNEACMHSIAVVKETEQTINFCKVQSILEVSVWNLKEWLHFRYEADKTLQTQVNLTNSKLIFKNRRQWDGMLMRIFVRCAINYDVVCISIKFTGIRNYPLPQQLDEILQQMEQHSTAITITAAPVKNKKSEASSKVTIIVVFVVCLLLISIVLVFIYVRRRRRRYADSRQRRNPSIHDKTDEPPQVELQMFPAAEYATPNSPIPEYSELEPLCEDSTERFHPVKKSVYDTPKQTGKGEWPPAGYRVPSVSTEDQKDENNLPDEHDDDTKPIV